jgi:DNA-binding transcriptional ArsR family regulator
VPGEGRVTRTFDGTPGRPYRPAIIVCGMTTEPPSRLQIRDPALMRALAHPARLAILDHLSNGVAATATEFAELVGLSPSATSYHLRALAKVGLIEEAAGRGDARERVWTSSIRGVEVDAGQHADPATREAEQELIDSVLVMHETRLRRYLAGRDEEPADWYDAATFTETLVQLTAEELAELRDKVMAMVRPYRKRERAAVPDGSRTVLVSFRAFPLLDQAMKD